MSPGIYRHALDVRIDRGVWCVSLLCALGSISCGTSTSASRDTHGATGSSSGGANGSGAGGALGAGGTFATGGSAGAGIIMVEAGVAGSRADASPPPSGGCDDSCLAVGMCVNNVCVINENPGHVDTGTQMGLRGGGPADGQFRWLYPYDKTVFARGLLPPTLQFDGTPPDALYVHLSSPGLDYQGFFGPSTPPRVSFSAPVWTAITSAVKGTDTLVVEVTKSTAGKVIGPIRESWTIAQGSLRGTVYYETVASKMLGFGQGPPIMGLPQNGGVGIMRIRPGDAAPQILKGGCGNVCHTASADGSTLVASSAYFSGVSESKAYDLRNNLQELSSAQNLLFVYGGLYPDGTFLMSSTHHRTWMSDPGRPPSRLYDTRSRANIPAPGWDGVVKNAGISAFSPDGKKIVFNHEDVGGGHSIAMMSFDVATKQFSGLADLASDPNAYLAWPTFTPDAKTVVYHAGSSAQFETGRGPNNGPLQTGDLFVVDVASRQTTRLDAADGYGAGASYLPANDPNMSFVPTVLPVAVGGYFWVMFTSHRSYGNVLASKSDNGKLWVAAVDIDAVPGQDPSHPAFYLDGQELEANNLRGFWVVDPCKASGGDCTSGDQCCEGYCRVSGGRQQCVSTPPNGCANEFEKCATSSECCDKRFLCINGRCAEPPPR